VRIGATAALGSLIALTLGVGADASPQFASTFQFTYSSQSPGSPSGIDGFSTWSDPGEPGGKPKEIVRIKVVLHPGSRLDTSALPACRTSDARVQRLGVRACPASTVLGSVKGEAVISVGQRFNTLATLFNAKREIIVVVTLNDRNGRVLTNFRDDVRRRSITINLKLPPGISLTSFRAHVPPHSRKKGKTRRTYMRTPPTCLPNGSWTTRGVFTYRDGSTQTHMATTPCTPGGVISRSSI
jgi:hypothetical protein